MAYVGAGQNKYTVFPLENYTFGHKSPKVEKQRNLEARFKHLKDKYASTQSLQQRQPDGVVVFAWLLLLGDRRQRSKPALCRYAEEGMRRTAEGILLVHQHNTIHALLLQPNPSFFRLPGGKLKPGEDGMARHVHMWLPIRQTASPSQSKRFVVACRNIWATTEADSPFGPHKVRRLTNEVASGGLPRHLLQAKLRDSDLSILPDSHRATKRDQEALPSQPTREGVPDGPLQPTTAPQRATPKQHHLHEHVSCTLASVTAHVINCSGSSHSTELASSCNGTCSDLLLSSAPAC